MNQGITNENFVRLNAICPYFTMFPLRFPYEILADLASPTDLVCDPFCGRGTTNYASRLLGLESIGVDSSPVAVAISLAKVANTTPTQIMRAANRILERFDKPVQMPEGEFWEWAFDKNVLSVLCRLREGLLADCRSDSRKALRAIILGALHGPRSKTKDSYFSNQSQRTYAPKPGYALHYWKKHDMKPPRVNVLQIIEERANRFYKTEKTIARGLIISGDSRHNKTFSNLSSYINWVITSPPYYGMRTYFPDQWLRMWFVGGSSNVQYQSVEQLQHSSPMVFSENLRQVWNNVGSKCASGAKLIVRFGGINDRKADPLTMLLGSLEGTNWRIEDIINAGNAASGHRQAMHIRSGLKEPRGEFDLWAHWCA